MQSELKPCPFCGADFKMGQEPQDNHPVAGQFYLYHNYGPLGSAARLCSLSINRHFYTEAEAIAAWNTRASEAEITRLTEALRAAEEEIEERDEWAQIVDTTPLDDFDKLADYWTQRFVIVRMTNAIASVFTKFAPEPIMSRFREGMRNIMHQAFVEGCIVGVKNERARARPSQEPSHANA